MLRIIVVLLLLSFFKNSYADIYYVSESEPNNIYSQADDESGPNWGFKGNISSTTDVDWWSFSLYGFGSIKIILKSPNGATINFALYSVNGTTLIANGNTNTSDSIIAGNLNFGSYYIKVWGYTNGVYNEYQIEPLVRNLVSSDPEPTDDTYAGAIGGGVRYPYSYQGHLNYEVNNYRDSVDWYKLAKSNDGSFKIHFSPSIGLKCTISFYIEYCCSGGDLQLISTDTASVEKDIIEGGLTGNSNWVKYYVKISRFQTDITEGMYNIDITQPPNVFGDEESNNDISHATYLPYVNATNRAHINYYYDHSVIDSVDWYRLTLPSDGDLRVYIVPLQSHTLSVYLYAYDGKTLLNTFSGNDSVSQKIYGLQHGQYYIVVKSSGIFGEWQNYKLGHYLTTYQTVDDAEPNNFFWQSKTIPANSFVTGHINFKNSGTESFDSVDTWKINYTGRGDMRLKLDLENRDASDSTGPVLFQVFKETYKPPIYSNYFSTSSGNIHLTNLTVGYYNVKLTGTNKLPNAYTLTDSFAQTKVDFRITSKSDVIICDKSNYIKVKCLGSHPPYTVKKYLTGEPVTVTELDNSLPVTYSNIKGGVYRFVAYADGATGVAIDTQYVFLLPTPRILSSYNITATTATIEWSRPYCNGFYSLRYRPVGTTTWIIYVTTGNDYFYNISNLNPNTTYEWQVAPGDSAFGVSGYGNYSVLDSFTTTSSFAATQSVDFIKTKNDHFVSTYPNPAKKQFVIQYNPLNKNTLVSLSLKNMNGNVVWNKNNISASTVNAMKVDIGNVPSGMYVLTISDQKNMLLATKKIIVSK